MVISEEPVSHTNSSSCHQAKFGKRQATLYYQNLSIGIKGHTEIKGQAGRQKQANLHNKALQGLEV
jgi:hypothetical protein